MSSSAISGPIFSDNKRAPSGTAAAPSFAFNDSTGTGVYLVSPGVLGLSTAGVQRVVVDASGNVGIGTASPTAKLTSHTTAFNPATSDWTKAAIATTGNYGGAIAIIDGSAGYSLRAEASGTAFAIAQGSTSGGQTERMRIDASGNLLVGRTSTVSNPGSNTPIVYAQNGIIATNGTVSANYQFNRINFNDGQFYVLNSSSVGVILTSGQTSWAAQSDKRSKKNIQSLELGLEQIKALKPARFDYKTDESDSSSRVGFIAQEVLSVLPHAVHVPEDSEKMMGVSTTEMIPVLVKAIQELEARLAALESK